VIFFDICELCGEEITEDQVWMRSLDGDRNAHVACVEGTDDG
jgi:hypothetical protein